MPPLRGLDLQGGVFLQRYHPYGIQERFEGSKVSAQSPVRLGMQIAFGCVHRAAKPNLPGLGMLRQLLFLKLTLMVRLGNREETPQQKPYRAWGSKIGLKTEN